MAEPFLSHGCMPPCQHDQIAAALNAARGTEPPFNATDALRDAIVDLCWRVTPYGTTEDGDISHYIVSKGTVHRLIGAAQGAGIHAAFRSQGVRDEDAGD